MKIFITGATGFIGRHLVELLARSGHELVALARPTSDASRLQKQGVTLVTGDVNNRESLRSGMRGCAGLVNLANVYSFWEPDNHIYEEVNVRGTRNVMECALEAGVAKVVHVSSVVVYGKPEQIPFSEESPVGPRRFSRYARSKYAGDLIAWDLMKSKGLPLVMVYPAPVLGPGNPIAKGPYIKNLLEGRMPATVFPASLLTLVHVRDVAAIIAGALAKKGNFGEKYFACNQALSFAEINALVRDIAGVSLPKLTLPSWLVMANASLLTAVSRLSKKPPPWGMSLDQMATCRAGLEADGSKAAKELGIVYTPIRTAMEEEIAYYQGKG